MECSATGCAERLAVQGGICRGAREGSGMVVNAADYAWGGLAECWRLGGWCDLQLLTVKEAEA